MSQLADAIRRSQKVESAPMGFGAARPAAKATMLVGALVVPAAIQSVADSADFIVIDARGSALSEAEASMARNAANSLPLGTWSKISDSSAARALRTAGIDFLIVEAEQTPAAAMLDEELGYVLVLPQEPEELFLRSLEPLSLEALLLNEVPSPLTVAGQIQLSRIAGLGRKPLLTQAPGSASSDDLQCLRAAGVVALVTAAEGVAGLKETVKSLPPRRSRRDDRTVISLPRGNAGQPDHDDDDDDRLTR
jgi:hypothetical protein